MVDKFSSNVIQILREVLKNQNICKYLYYSVSNPLSQSNIVDTKSLMFNNLFPYPFNPNINDKDITQLHVYYGKGNFEPHAILADTKLLMDIIIPSTLYLVNDGGETVRPYAIMSLLTDFFADRVIGSMGYIFFESFVHLNINEKYDCVRLICNTKNIR